MLLTFLLCYRLSITCDNSIYGCTSILKLDALTNHLTECEHNPKKPVPCGQGCGLIIPMDELKANNFSYTLIITELLLNLN